MNEIRLTEEQKSVLKKAVDEGVGSMYRKDAEMDLMREIANRIRDELGLPPKLFRKLVRTAYKSNAKDINQETTELLDLAEELGIYSHNEEE